MSNSHTSMQSNRVQKIVFKNDQEDRRAVWTNAQGYEHAFHKVLRRMGFEHSFPMELADGHGFTNIALSVIDCQQASGSGPRLLIPIDPQSNPDERVIEASLARSIGLMLADAAMYDQIWVDTHSDLQSRFAKRPEASLEKLILRWGLMTVCYFMPSFFGSITIFRPLDRGGSLPISKS